MVQIPPLVLDLIAKFDTQSELYEAPTYNETQLRIDFVNPMFEALGWDIDNTKGYAEAFREVVHEDAVKIAGTVKSPDYSFRIGGRRIFFLEAKKPAVNIRDDVGPAYQLRRYAWTAGLPLSILTNFREFAVYDCRVPPKYLDKASTARLWYFTYQNYPQKWDEIAAVFSPEAIQHGAFDRYVQSHKKSGTQAFDDAFLDEMEEWREKLAGNLAMRNAGLDQSGLNFATQRIIDRIVFLRICEDRGIEPPFQLQGLLPGEQVYARLRELFTKGDHRYNSGLFHFREEKGRHESPDELTPNLGIDDETLKHIIRRLYYPDSPYVFKAVAADILGSVYERFLGNVIRLTAGHRAKIEPKPEVRKAGGVYYTPTYIVDYIVKHTVGKLLEGKTPSEAAKLRILDPACGSGSFLLGAYQCLLDWHEQWYVAHDPDKRIKGKNATLRPGPQRQLVLSIRERKRILLDNIHGVDLDPQAVEVTKLSLLLKCLEGESAQSIDDLRLFHERALPDLGDNIKCGNSLISTDIYDTDAWKDLSEAERSRLRPFNWQDEFPKIMKSGGFDAVIGNPPYVDIKSLPDADCKYIFQSYKCANNRINLFAAFIERTLALLRQRDARFAMIVPTALLTQDSYRALRRQILENARISSVVRLPNESFGARAGDVKVDTVIVVLAPHGEEQLTEIVSYAGYERITAIKPDSAHLHRFISQGEWASSDECVWSFDAGGEVTAILSKCEQESIPLAECAEFCLGLTPYDKYKGHTPQQIETQVFHAKRKKNATFKPLLGGNDVLRYHVRWNGGTWISYGPWLGAPREPRFFKDKRILVKQIIDWTTKRIWAAMTTKELYNTQNAFNLIARPSWVLQYLLGILNSRLMTFYHRKKYLDDFKMRFQKILIRDCKRFPIRPAGSSEQQKNQNRADDRIAALVDQMLSLHKSLSAAKSPPDKEALQRRIDATDRQIDRLVYELYGLTEEDIKIVEEATQ